MEKYSYDSAQKAKISINQLAGIIGVLFFSVIGTGLLFEISIIEVNGKSTSLIHDPRVTLVCAAVWCILISWLIGITFINYLPTIWISEEGLKISAFLFFHILILWKDIVDVGAGRPPKGCILVRVRKISPFHRLYGWAYSFSLYPSFLIGNVDSTHKCNFNG